MAYLLAITKDGKDINSTDPRDFALHSDYPVLKAELQAQGVASAADAASGLVITHNLGYNPMFLFYTEIFPDTGVRYLATGDIASGMPYIINSSADLNSIYVYSLQEGADYYYYIFADQTIE